MADRIDGFTLVELTIVLVVMAVISAVAIPRIGMMIESSREAATLQEMQQLKRAIVGDPRVEAGGQLVNAGYEGDVGALPPDLTALATKPGSVTAWNRFTRTGWNGPYIDDNGNDYLSDAWGAAYQYDSGARTITSNGGTQTLVISF